MDIETWLKEKAGLSGPRLTAAIEACEAGMVYTMKDLLELSEMEEFKEAFSQALLRGKVKAALERDKDNIKAQDSTTDEKDSPKVLKVSSSSAIPQTEQQMQPQISATKSTDQTTLQLPPDKLYHFFASHKKLHSVHGSISEAIARGAKDWLEDVRGFRGFFDVDNLVSISLDALTTAIKSSACVVLFLDDETHQSKWCVHELNTAKTSGIPIICVIDQDRFQQRPIISQYQELGFDHIFSEQVVGYTSENRKVAFDKISKGISRAVAAQNTKAAVVVKTKKTKPSAPKIHKDDADNDQLFRQLVLKHYTDAGNAFSVFQSDDGLLGRKDFKKLVRSVGMKIDEDNRKQLRKRITSRKAIDRDSFVAFFGISESSTNDVVVSSSNTDGLAALPIEGNESYIIQ